MKVTPKTIVDVMIIEPKVFGDARGFFFESFNQLAFNDTTGTDYQFAQDNHNRSTKGGLRGLHYQSEHPQGKRCIVWNDQAIDINWPIDSSPTCLLKTSRGARCA